MKAIENERVAGASNSHKDAYRGDPKKDCGNKKGAVAAPKRISQCTDHSMGLPFAEMILSLTPEIFEGESGGTS